MLVGAAAFFIWHYENNRAIAADRARFEQADKDVKTIAAAIKSVVPPEKEDLSEECTHQSREFEAEPIVCDTKYKVRYGTNNVPDASSVQQRYEEVLNHYQQILKFKSTVETPSGNDSFMAMPTAGNSEVLSKIYIDRVSGLSCTQTYELFSSSAPPSYYAVYQDLAYALNLVVTIDCGGTARAAYFSLNS